MIFKLIHKSGPKSGEETTVTGSEFVIGRSPSCHLRLEDELVADRHCRIMIKGDRAIIEDLETTHGTSVNHQLVSSTELHDGDRLKLGTARFLVAKLAGSAYSAASDPIAAQPVAAAPIEPLTIPGITDSVPDSPATQIARHLLDQITHRKIAAPELGHLRLGECEGITLVELLSKGKAIVEDEIVAAIAQELFALIEGGRERIVLNFKNIERISIQAVSAVIDAHRHCVDRGGMLKVCKLRPLAVEIFQATARKRIEIYPDEWSAVDSDWPEKSQLELDELALVPKPGSAKPDPFVTNLASKAAVEPPNNRPQPQPQSRPQPQATSAGGKGAQINASTRTAGPMQLGADSTVHRPAQAAPIPKPATSPSGSAIRITGNARDAAATAPTLELGLEVLVGKSKGQIVEIHTNRFVIGRDPRCQLRPNSDSISRIHTKIEQRDGKVFVRDLGAVNGTIINGNVLHAQEVEVRNGDQLQVGPLVFVFQIKPRKPALETAAVDDFVASWVLEEGNAQPESPTSFAIPVYRPEKERDR
jgi:pSer/pThr/pTyr-binding forkhead associated (FHA) protein